ncbi:MAG: hypothetical protein QE269_00775 [Fimbriimonas sp.]|nr:hypothetical protein [Fimbriimonas sp.]
MVKSLSLGIAFLFVVGCGPNPDGDVAAGEEAARKSPPVSKIEDLPADMPPQARAQAEAAIKQQEAQRKFAEEQAAKSGGPKPN